MRFFRRGRRLVRMILSLATVAVVLSGCQSGAVSIRDIALDIMRGADIRTQSAVVGDSVCTIVVFRHPLLADSIGVYQGCFPLRPVAPDSTDGISDAPAPIGILAR